MNKEKKIDWAEVWKPLLVGIMFGIYYNYLPNIIIGVIGGMIFLVAYRQIHPSNIKEQ